MGVKGLLPFLKKASCSVHLSEFSGYTVAIDAYCWIHKSSYACATELALGTPTDQYVRYTVKFLEMIFSYNIKPILVFDGANLPSKAETESERRENKELQRKKAAQFLAEGNQAAADQCFARSIYVTSQMAHEVLKAARCMGVDCIVAPYEADAQLAYLNRAGYADLIITEDSDLLMFGCRQVIFKLDINGSGVLVAVSNGIGELCCGMPAGQFNDDQLRFMGVMAGCDYFPGVPGIGLTTAAKILRQARPTNFRDLLTRLGRYTNLGRAVTKTLSADGRRAKQRSNQLDQPTIEAALRADRAFRLQVVFDPSTRSQRRLTRSSSSDLVDEGKLDEGGPDFNFAGVLEHDSQRAFQLALGNIDCLTGRVVDNFDPADKWQVRRLSNTQSKRLLEPSGGDRTMIPVLGGGGGLVSHYVEKDETEGSNNGLANLSCQVKSRPSQTRLNFSLWSRDYPLQKVWLQRLPGDASPALKCFLVSPPNQQHQQSMSNGIDSSTVLSLSGLDVDVDQHDIDFPFKLGPITADSRSSSSSMNNSHNRSLPTNRRHSFNLSLNGTESFNKRRRLDADEEVDVESAILHSYTTPNANPSSGLTTPVKIDHNQPTSRLSDSSTLDSTSLYFNHSPPPSSIDRLHQDQRRSTVNPFRRQLSPTFGQSPPSTDSLDKSPTLDGPSAVGLHCCRPSSWSNDLQTEENHSDQHSVITVTESDKENSPLRLQSPSSPTSTDVSPSFLSSHVSQAKTSPCLSSQGQGDCQSPPSTDVVDRRRLLPPNTVQCPPSPALGLRTGISIDRPVSKRTATSKKGRKTLSKSGSTNNADLRSFLHQWQFAKQ